MGLQLRSWDPLNDLDRQFPTLCVAHTPLNTKARRLGMDKNQTTSQAAGV